MTTPTMLYRCPGPHVTDGIAYEYVIVDASEVDAKLAEGWHRHYIEADEATQQAVRKLEANERELERVEAQLEAAPKIKAVHKGRGVYELHDESGRVVSSGLTKQEAQAQAA